MEYFVLASVGLAFLAYSVSIRQLEIVEITGPMFFVLVGMLIAYMMPTSVTSKAEFLQSDLDTLLPLIELTLSIFLFTDAAKTKISVLKHSFQYPSLLLFLALPLTLFAGIVIASLMFTQLTLVQAGLIAIILTPTDAALSKGLLSSEQVPEKIREGINTESGLNDGLCVPVFLVLMLFAQEPETSVSLASIAGIFSRELVVAIVIAIVAMAMFIPLIKFAMKRHYFSNNTSPFLVIGMAMAIFSIAQCVHSSGFIAVFVAGLIFDRFTDKGLTEQLVEDSEHIADFTSLLIWCLFGYVCSYLVFPEINWQVTVFAILSVTLLRIIPVMLSLQFTKLNIKERFTFAWFGPRGLASIVFTLMVIDTQIENKYQIATVAMTTILFSVFIHGMSTKPIADSYAK
ncbi:cation:proton antiporter [Pseudoalteromonas shioyasakiensis]|uniref:cation:proton antiporter n=1 Tax=Pseudoalteromonas shioyasakiensis TaxID=1190813 RepID=UPI0021198DC8|nr:cation:proton antiporter [Pseudoalteromonas shioyasakiensis]MCQ8878296.1 cation:proton antiporter [Pseudoalteromonas shioyasakiensis]